jgi:hypothetical protein
MLYEEGHFSLKDPVSNFHQNLKNLVVTFIEEKEKRVKRTALNREINIVD